MPEADSDSSAQDVTFLRRIRPVILKTVATGILITLFLGWLSTGITIIGLEESGLRYHLGHADKTELGPGLHFSFPWPWGRIRTIETTRLRELVLGLDRDLGGPVLWTKEHYVGEKSLLVGRGEELLTISVPITYRISSVRNYLLSTKNPEEALNHLAYRQLLKETIDRASFEVMIADRDLLAETLRENLQSDADAIKLGVEITFVGLKDIHPPVAVTDAYQAVISAREEKRTIIDQAKAYHAETVPAAQRDAYRKTVEANAQAQVLKMRAGAEGLAFRQIAAGWRAPEILQHRWQMELIEEFAGEKGVLVVDETFQERPDVILNLPVSE